MAVLNSGTNTTVQQLVSLMSLLGLTLGDRAGLIADPVLGGAFAGDMSGARATSAAVPRSNLGTIVLASETEGTGVANTDPTYARDTVVVAGRRLLMENSDLFAALQLGHPGGPESIAIGLVDSTMLTLASIVASLSTGYSTSEGTAGAALTLVDLLAAQARLAAANADGPTLAVLASRQMSQLRLDALTVSGGQAAFSPRDNDRPGDRIKSGTYIADFFGSAVAVSNQVPTSGGDRVGMLVGAQAFKWAYATPVAQALEDMVIPAMTTPDGRILPPLLLRRTAARGTGVFGQEAFAILGAAEAQDLAGTRLISVNS